MFGAFGVPAQYQSKLLAWGVLGAIAMRVVLGFVGCKMLLAEVYKIPTGVALGVVAAILGVAMLASWLAPAMGEQAEAEEGSSVQAQG